MKTYMYTEMERIHIYSYIKILLLYNACTNDCYKSWNPIGSLTRQRLKKACMILNSSSHAKWSTTEMLGTNGKLIAMDSRKASIGEAIILNDDE